jgi:glutaredoxin
METEVKKVTTPIKVKTEPPRYEKEFWKKDKVKNNHWTIYYINKCNLAPKAYAILQNQGEKNIQYIMHSEYSAQEAITKGYNFSPAIYLNGKFMGSLSELESYYNRNYFSSIQEATQ